VPSPLWPELYLDPVVGTYTRPRPPPSQGPPHVSHSQITSIGHTLLAPADAQWGFAARARMHCRLEPEHTCSSPTVPTDSLRAAPRARTYRCCTCVFTHSWA
jgi:hypothetical protein